MKTCRQCGQIVQDIETYCPRCGSSQLVTNLNKQPSPSYQQQINQNQTVNTPNRQVQTAPSGYRNPNSVRGQGNINQGFRAPERPQNPQNNMNGNMGFDAVQPFQNQVVTDNEDTIVSWKEWLILMLKLLIPIYSLYTIIRTLTNKKVKKSMREYMKASLIFTAGSILVSLVFCSLLSMILSNIYWYY